MNIHFKYILAIIIFSAIMFGLGYLTKKNKTNIVETVRYDTLYKALPTEIIYEPVYLDKVKFSKKTDTCLVNNDASFDSVIVHYEVLNIDTTLIGRAIITIDNDTTFSQYYKLRTVLNYYVSDKLLNGAFMLDTMRIDVTRKDVIKYVTNVTEIDKKEIPSYYYYISHTAAALGGYLIAK